MRNKKISAIYPHENNNSGDNQFGFYEILDSIPVPIFIKDIIGIFTNCNKAYEKFMGLNRDDIIGKTVYDIAPKNLADEYHKKDKELFEQGNVEVYEGTVTIKGMDRYVLFHKSVYRSSVGEIQGLVGAIIDITAQKKAEQLLKQRIAFENVVSTISADCLRVNSDIDTVMLCALTSISRVMEATNSYIFITESDGKSIKQVYHWNVSAPNSVILNIDSLTNNSSIHWNIMKGIVQEFENTQERTTYYELHNEKSKRILFPLKNENEWLGSFNLEWAKERCIELSNEHITLLKLLADVFVGMLQRQKTNEEIHKLTLVVEQSPGEILITDINRKIVYANSTFSKKYGYTLDELKGNNISLIMSGLQSDEFYRDREKTISTGNKWRGEVCGRGKSGEIFWTLVSLSQFRKLDGEIVGYISMGQDITEKKIMEETLDKQSTEIKDALANLKQTQVQLVQQEKLAGIGQLAAGVAHEINNPLGFVLSNFDSLKKYLIKITDVFHKYGELKDKVLESDTQNLKELAQQLVVFEKQKKIAYIFEDLAPIIQESDDGLKRLGDIVKALKLFSRVDKSNEFECYDLNTGIKNTLIIAKNEIKYIAEIEVDLGELPEIQASAGQINQVLLNIIINAAHAIKEKEMDILGMVRITSYHDDQYIYCSIQDNGIGMKAETIKNIFDAFFTTKPSGQGTGLGLSISYDIVVNKHCGDISVISEKGIGTTFTIKLPLIPSCARTDK